MHTSTPLEKSIIEEMKKKKLISVEGLAKDLDVDKKELEKALDILVLKGILEEVHEISSCSENCSACPLRRVCMVSRRGFEVKFYSLSKKERENRYIG
ncbi:MAG: FeoC-like transcriptional regulator [Fervidicoccaceae archaeon]